MVMMLPGVHPRMSEDVMRDEVASVDRRGVSDAERETSRH